MQIESLYQYYLKHPVICTDTRKLTPGCFYVALKGANFDGNKFAKQALEQGAAYCLIDDVEQKIDERCILVDDSLTALQALAHHHRKQFKFPVIGITGSNGKTTTKEFIHAVLSKKYKTYATVGNYNNHIGVPLTLLAIDHTYEIAVIEMGANHQKEIEALSNISDPDYGMITNIGKAHIEGFGGFEGIIKGKSELYQHLRAKQGKIFINRDNAILKEKGEGIEQILYSTQMESSLQGKVENLNPYLAFSWRTPTYESPVIQSNLVGAYNLDNMLAAIAIGHYFGVPAEAINEAISEYTPTNNRSQIERTENNTLILDAYNANPTSMKAALENFHQIESTKKFFILGDMLELGDESAENHIEIIDLLASKGLNEGIFVGAEFEAVKKGNHQFFPSIEAAKNHLSSLALKDYLILVKGSRGIRLEHVVDLL